MILKPLFATALLLSVVTPVLAQDDFRQHFMEEWDLNGDGSITLEEIIERRGNVFMSFDADEDGFLRQDERAMMDEMRNSMHQNDAGGQGMQHGKGMNKGMGQQSGMGNGRNSNGGGGRLQNQAEAGMHNGSMIDTDGDGIFSREEFVGMSQRWLARMDNDGDGVITKDDF